MRPGSCFPASHLAPYGQRRRSPLDSSPNIISGTMHKQQGPVRSFILFALCARLALLGVREADAHRLMHPLEAARKSTIYSTQANNGHPKSQAAHSMAGGTAAGNSQQQLNKVIQGHEAASLDTDDRASSIRQLQDEEQPLSLTQPRLRQRDAPNSVPDAELPRAVPGDAADTPAHTQRTLAQSGQASGHPRHATEVTATGSTVTSSTDSSGSGTISSSAAGSSGSGSGTSAIRTLSSASSSSGSSTGQAGPAQAGAVPLTDDDFVVAMPGVSGRIKMAHSTRVWRQDMRTAIVIEDGKLAGLLQEGQPSEVYMVWPDEISYTGALTKDVRAALVPAMAHRVFGGTGKRRGYKWMLYGDDDTLFFMDNVKAMLQDYDHTLPYMISDNLWWDHYHHNFAAPRCLPCHLKSPETEAALLNATRGHWTYRPPWGCPYCTTTLSCQWYWDRMPKRKKHKKGAAANATISASPSLSPPARRLRARAGQAGRTVLQAEPQTRTLEQAKILKAQSSAEVEDKETEQVELEPLAPVSIRDWEPWSLMPQAPPGPPGSVPEGEVLLSEWPATKAKRRACHHPVAHGGAGVILSVGLMERLDFDLFVSCVRKLRQCAGGDCRFAVCIRDVLGVGFTDPGHSVLAGNDKTRTVFDNEPIRQLKRLPSEAVARGLCDEVCQWQVANALATHIKARSHHSLNLAAAHMYFASHSHQAAQGYLRLSRESKEFRIRANATITADTAYNATTTAH